MSSLEADHGLDVPESDEQEEEHEDEEGEEGDGEDRDDGVDAAAGLGLFVSPLPLEPDLAQVGGEAVDAVVEDAALLVHQLVEELQPLLAVLLPAPLLAVEVPIGVLEFGTKIITRGLRFCYLSPPPKKNRSWQMNTAQSRVIPILTRHY